MPTAAPATLRDVLNPDDQAWLQERFRVAAHNRYLHLEAACDTSTACPGAVAQSCWAKMRCHATCSIVQHRSKVADPRRRCFMFHAAHFYNGCCPA